MAITNPRVYDAQALKAAGVSLGGLSKVTVQEGHENVIRSRDDGRVGQASIHRTGKRFSGTIESKDVTKVMSLLTAAPNDAADILEFYEAQDATSPVTFKKHVILRPRFTGLSVRIPEPNGLAMFTVNFESLWILTNGDAATAFNEVHAVTSGVSAATVTALLTRPEELCGVRAAAHGAKSILSRSAMNFRLEFDVRRDRNPEFAGPDSIIPILRGVLIDITTKDATLTSGKTTMQDLLDAGAADLTATLGKVNGTAHKVLTFKNAKALEYAGTHPFDNYGEFTPNFECESFSGSTHYTVGTMLTIADEA